MRAIPITPHLVRSLFDLPQCVHLMVIAAEPSSSLAWKYLTAHNLLSHFLWTDGASQSLFCVSAIDV
jgi:hypothetical protein